MMVPRSKNKQKTKIIKLKVSNSTNNIEEYIKLTNIAGGILYGYVEIFPED